MAKKKNTPVPVSQEENAQAQHILEQYRQLAAHLHTCKDRQQAEKILAELNSLPEGAQMALLRELSKENTVDAADILVAINELAALKEVRKEARRSLIRLEGAKIYPRWKLPAEAASAVSISPFLTNPPRFWKGFVTDSLEAGEVQLLLCWQQGEDYKEVRVLGFLLEFWHDGVKDFFTNLESKRSFENFLNQVHASTPGVKLEDCSLAEGRRLLQKALDTNTRFGTKPHRDYQLHLSLVNQLILSVPGLAIEDLSDEEDEDVPWDNLHGLKPLEVVTNFVEYWTEGDYDFAYQLLAHDSPLREGLAKEEWVERRETWAETFEPLDLEPSLLYEREAPKSKFWLPSSFSRGSTLTTKEIEAGWSIELEKTPLEDRLPELPEATAIYPETGRHWFWASYTLVQEGEEWRIQRITDEGQQAQSLPIDQLKKRIEELGNEAEKLAEKQDPDRLEQSDDPEIQQQFGEILRCFMRMVYFSDALLKKAPLEREIYERASFCMAMLGQYERCLVYMVPLAERFTEERALLYRRMADILALQSERSFEQEDDERSELFEKLAEQALRTSLTIEDTCEAHISLAKLLVEQGEKLDEAEDHLRQAGNTATEPDDQMHIEFHLGEIATEREDLQQALRHYQRATEINPREAAAWSALGDAHRTLKDYEEAETSYKHALELQPGNAEYYSALALLYKDTEQIAKAISTLEDGLTASPDSLELYTALVAVYITEEDYEQAEIFLEKAERIDPDEPLIMTYRQILTLSKAKPPLASHQPKKLSRPKKKGTHHSH